MHIQRVQQHFQSLLAIILDIIKKVQFACVNSRATIIVSRRGRFGFMVFCLDAVLFVLMAAFLFVTVLMYEAVPSTKHYIGQTRIYLVRGLISWQFLSQLHWHWMVYNSTTRVYTDVESTLKIHRQEISKSILLSLVSKNWLYFNDFSVRSNILFRNFRLTHTSNRLLFINS